MRRLAPLALLTLLTLLLAVLLPIASERMQSESLAAGTPSDVKATRRFYPKRPSKGIVLPTGCARGFGPQYRSFDPELGEIFTISGDTFVVFNPAKTCEAAASVCASQLSGTSCCKNACMQQHSGHKVGQVTFKEGVAFFADGTFDPTGIGAIFDPEGFSKCEAKCVLVPTVQSKVLGGNPAIAPVRTLRRNPVKR